MTVIWMNITPAALLLHGSAEVAKPQIFHFTLFLVKVTFWKLQILIQQNLMNKSIKLDIISTDLEDHPLLNNREIDPDSNLYVGLSWDSPYSTPDSLTENLKAVPYFHIMHLNCRSLFNKITEIE